MYYWPVKYSKDWLLGVIIVIQFGKYELALRVNKVMRKEDCSETKIDGMPCTNCSSDVWPRQIYVSDLPHDLGADLRCLYSYDLLINNLSSDTFINYPNLTHLYFIRAGFSEHFRKDTFEPLKKLHYFNLTNTNWFLNTEITWPSSVRILDITKFPVNTFVGLTLDFLEVLNVSSTLITEFPTLSEIAPLKVVVLDNTNLTNFKIEDIAKLCKLESISTRNMYLGKDNCKCLILKAWTEKYNVTIMNEMECKVDTKCVLSFSETSLKNRNECLARNEQAKIWYYIVFAFVALLILILCASGFLYTWLVKKEEKEGILGITDEELKHFTPHPHQTTGSPKASNEQSTSGGNADKKQAK